MPKALPMTNRTEVKRLKERASYDREAICTALDDALIGTKATHALFLRTLDARALAAYPPT
jgi:hypothetical protein